MTNDLACLASTMRRLVDFFIMPTETLLTEADILADVVAAGDGDLSPDVARSILRWKFPRRSVSQMNRLVQRNRRGTITALERETLERYLRVGSLLNLLQAKARLSLKSQAASDRQKIEEGLEDIRADRIVPHDEVFADLEEAL